LAACPARGQGAQPHLLSAYPKLQNLTSEAVAYLVIIF
jgi:hypothetical protein